MFEDSLMESGHEIKAKSKYWSVVSLLVNGGLLVAFIIWPLLHPEALPRQMMATLMVAPSPPPPPPPPAPPPKVQVKSEMLNSELLAPSRIPKQIKTVNEAAAPPSMDGVIGMENMGSGTPGGMGTILGSVGMGTATVVKSEPANRVNVSSGVMAGNLVVKTMPQYPAISKAARIQGTVVLQATISRTGSIENLRVISGPPMLQQAAIDAVRTWRYRPYLLNGEPVEVETTINVVFNLGE
jgi:periplasmic protein TonB